VKVFFFTLKRCLAGVTAGLALAGVSSAAEVQRDIEYGRVNGVSLRLDVGPADGKEPVPVAILVHGGGWSTGDKSGSNRPGDSADITPWFALVHSAGFTWFSINYRLAPKYPWPACRDDVSTAIRWVKAHAAEYGGDPRRIVLFGHSAGGHLVYYAGTNPTPGADVKAVVGFAPVTDLFSDAQTRGGLSQSLQWLFGLPKTVTPETAAVLQAASPMQYVKPGLPAFLLVHGTLDQTVPFPMSLDFQSKMRAAGNVCDLIPVERAPHSMMKWEGKDPSYQAKVIEWLRRVVR